jgi:hypothetical protein
MSIDGIKKAVSNTAAGALGNPKKAFLIIHSVQDTSELASVEELAEKVLLLREGGGDLDGAAISNIFGGEDGMRVMQVQYNPSSLDISAHTVEISAKRLQQNIVSDIPPQFTRPASVTLAVDLVFDAVNVKDSFMSEKFNISIGGIVTSGAALKNRANYTVQPQTNALVSMLMSVYTRHATFCWSGLAFHGIVSETRAKYTMFSVSGRPVRSLVSLVIQQDLNGPDGSYWDKAFDKCFGAADSDGTFGGQSIGQNVGNLLNFGF